MKVGFHPVADNPIRMAFVPGWESIARLLLRLDELERKVDGGKVIPAPWEPFYRECPSCREARAYAWARRLLETPSELAVFLAFFPGDEAQPATSMAQANRLMLRAKGEPSKVTGKLILAEALDLWEIHETSWLEQTVAASAGLGIRTSVEYLRPHVRRALTYLEHPVPAEDTTDFMLSENAGPGSSHGFDRELLQLEGWTQDPGTVILPVDGKFRSLAGEILLLNVHKIALLKRKRLIRSVEWEKVTLVYLFEGVLHFDIQDEPPLTISGYQQPEAVLLRVQECYRAATERILQGLATQAIRTVS